MEGAAVTDADRSCANKAHDEGVTIPDCLLEPKRRRPEKKNSNEANIYDDCDHARASVSGARLFVRMCAEKSMRCHQDVSRELSACSATGVVHTGSADK